MIGHRPYGIEDPYKRLPTERFPREPLPGEPIQVSFETSASATTAWVSLTGEVEDRSIPALHLGQGLWTAELGALQSGRYSYVIQAQLGKADGGGRESSEAFEFEVGRWIAVKALQSARPVGSGVLLGLTSSEGPVQLALSFPISGVCRSELLIGHEVVVRLPGLSSAMEWEGSLLRLRSSGIEIEIDSDSLDLTVGRPGSEPSFRGSLLSRWLIDSRNRVSRVQAQFTPQPDEWLYGLGERFTEANRLGEEWDVRIYEEFQEQGKRAYLPVPFLVSNRNYGLWLDANEPSQFDLRLNQDEQKCSLTRQVLPSKEASLPLHILVGEQAYDLTAAFVRLTGEMRVPPKWAFGPWMSANTWNSQQKAEEVVSRTLNEDVPASVLVLEAWSDESTFYIFNDAKYRPKEGGEAFSLADFEFGGSWPDPKGLIDYCHENGIRVVLWQIPVQKKLDEPHEQNRADEQHMLEQEYSIRNADGSPYRNNGWWFADGLVTDFSNPDAREWWFSKRRYLFDELGIDGMKTDGGEHLWGKELRSHDGRRGLELYNTYANAYVSAYHEFVQRETGGDGVTFSRAGYSGAQQWPSHWAGDEASTWNAYRASIQAGLSAGVSGISMWGWDLAGFSGDIPSSELYLRATAMATFCPLMQYHSELHSASECRDRTPWNVAERHSDPQVLDVYRRFAKLRMRLLDYIHGEAKTLSATGIPLMRYPALEFPEAHDFLSVDPYAYLFGRDLIVFPVVEKGAATREVRLPPGEWLDLWSSAKFAGGRKLSVPAPLNRIPVFVAAQSLRAPGLLEAVAHFYGDDNPASRWSDEASRPWSSGAFGAPMACDDHDSQGERDPSPRSPEKE